MERKLMVTAVEIVSDLGVSRAYAYNLIKRLNAELEAKGYITISGKVSRKYYEEKIYGMQSRLKKKSLRNGARNTSPSDSCSSNTSVGIWKMCLAMQ